MLNKKLRKTASFALAGVMVISLAACGGEDEKENKNTPVPTQAGQPSGGGTQGDTEPGGDTQPGTTTENTVEPHQGSTPRICPIGGLKFFEP